MSDATHAVTLQVHTRSEAETRHFAQRLAHVLQAGDVVGLEGELGAGKTCFVRGLAEGMKIDPSQVSSPTFVLVHEYASPAPSAATLTHIDAYRLAGPDDLESIGFRDILAAKDAVIAIEWPSRIAAALPAERITVAIEAVSDIERNIRISAPPSFEARLTRIGATATVASNARRTQCRTCGKAIDAGIRTYPFCSDRCRMADLGGWFSGGYKMSRPLQNDDELSE